MYHRVAMTPPTPELHISGRLIKVAAFSGEAHVPLPDPANAVASIRGLQLSADLFTFREHVPQTQPRYPFPHTLEEVAVLPVKDYEHWWRSQLNDKARNLARKAAKKGVEIRPVAFDDVLIRGIKDIYDETPVRQGRPFKHYGKDIATLTADHATFLEKSDFVGAFFGPELVGFIKIVHEPEASNLMQIISKIAHRDKAPTNALLAKAVEICAAKTIPYLTYGSWSRRGLGDFKRQNGFQRMALPRYFVPLTFRGRIALRLGLQRPLQSRLPPSVQDTIATLRSRWIESRRTRLGASKSSP